MFDLGTVEPTKLSLKRMKALGIEPTRLLQLHNCMDWPDLTQFERDLNAQAIENSRNVFARYKIGEHIFIVETYIKEGQTIIKMVEEV